MKKPIDIVIPVYGDYLKTKACIESVLKHTSSIHKIIVINDKSPEIKINKYLNSITKAEKRIDIITHLTNEGFVRSVNEGMAQSDVKDVLLLNSDTIVTTGWVDKIQKTAYARDNVATVTPFSNSATLFSYPVFFADNELPSGYTADSMNELFEQSIFNRIIEVPSGVGFAMYITRRAIKEIGFFDDKAFGKGYGEENDFCFKAESIGLINVGCPDTFIFHNHGSSFGDTKFELMANAARVLKLRYPDYQKKIQKFTEEDPFLELRAQVDLLRIASSGLPGILLIDHGRGGGVSKHIEEISANSHLKYNIFILQPVADGVVLFSRHYPNIKVIIIHDNWYKKLIQVVKALNVKAIHYHHWIGYENIILSLAGDASLPYLVTFHDFYSVCPRIHFVNQEGVYCHEPTNESICDLCYPEEGETSMFRKINHKFLNSSSRLIAPSNDTRARILRYYPDLQISVRPHSDKYPKPKIESSYSGPRGQLGIMVAGNINDIKGISIIEETIKKANLRKLPLRWYFVGNVNPKSIAYDNCEYLGTYSNIMELSEKISKKNIDISFVASVCPETYCYTISESWYLRKPVLTFNLGAQAERIKETSAGWVIDEPFSTDRILGKVLQILNNKEDFVQKKQNTSLALSRLSKTANDYYSFLNLKNMKIKASEADQELIAKLARNYLLSNPKIISTIITLSPLRKLWVMVTQKRFNEIYIKISRELRFQYRNKFKGLK